MNKNNSAFKPLEEIRIENYRNYLDFTAEFKDSITTLVGANESGKTNLLMAIQHLEKRNTEKKDTCYFCENSWNKSPKIYLRLNSQYLDLNIKSGFIEIEISEEDIQFSNNSEEELLEYEDVRDLLIKYNKKSDIDSNQIEIAIPDSILSLYPDLKAQGIIKLINNEPVRLSNMSYSDQKTWSEHVNEFFKGGEVRISGVLPKIQKEKLIEKILKNNKIVYWSYSESNFIRDSVSLQAFKATPDNYKYLQNLFTIANVELDDFFKYTGNLRQKMLLKVSEKASELIAQNWKQSKLEFELNFGENNIIFLNFKENGTKLEPSIRSEGFKWYYSFLLEFNARFNSEIKNAIILLDEPGIHLHPGGQRILLKQLEDLSEENQIIYTTHLPFMINRMFPNRIINLKKKDGITEIQQPSAENVLDDRLLASTLGFSFNILSNWGEINLFVEGFTDKILLEKIIMTKVESDHEIILDLNDITIIYMGGLKNLEHFIRVSQETHSKYLIFIDNDDAGKKYFKKYSKPKKQRKKMDENTFENFILLDDGLVLEDYIPTSILNEALQNLISNDDKIYNRVLHEEVFNDKDKSSQIGELFIKIDKFIEENEKNSQNKKEDLKSEYSKHKIKSDLILEVLNIISTSNISEFSDLIEKIKEIQIKAENIYNL
jgi:predicted ATP-dependent endonuclease of OLD family